MPATNAPTSDRPHLTAAQPTATHVPVGLDEPDPSFAEPPSADRFEGTARALAASGFTVLVARDRDEARAMVLDLLPEGAEVHQGASQTLDELGITRELAESGRYDAIRPRLWSMDRATQGNEMRRLGAAPDYMLGSVQAVTEDGQLVAASKTGSQLGPYASGAGHVILVAGAQKIVADLPAALRRIERYSLPIEDVRSREAYGVGSAVNKVLILRGELRPDRVTVILVREPVGT